MERSHQIQLYTGDQNETDSIPMEDLKRSTQDSLITINDQEWVGMSHSSVTSLEAEDRQKPAEDQTSLSLQDGTSSEQESFFVIDETKWGEPPPSPPSSLSSLARNEKFVKLWRSASVPHDRPQAGSSAMFVIDDTTLGNPSSSSGSSQTANKQSWYGGYFRKKSLSENATQAERERFINIDEEEEDTFISPSFSPNRNRRHRFGILSKTLSIQEDSGEPESEALLQIEESQRGDKPASPISSSKSRSHYKYDKRSELSALQGDGSLDSCAIGANINQGFLDIHRQDSNIHTRFDGDAVLLFRTPTKQKRSVRKTLLAVWCAGCLSHLMCTCPCNVYDLNCSCRDQQGVHCMHKLKKKIKARLLVVQGVLCALAVVLSGMVFLPLGNVTADFDGQCLLYSDIALMWISKNNSVSVDLAKTKYGSANDCNYTTFLSVVVAIVSLFFIWFFIHTKKVSGLEYSEVKLQLPVFLLHFILVIAVIVSSFKISIGFNQLCYNLLANNPYPIRRWRLQCGDYENLSWTTNNRSTFYTYMALAEVATWLLTLTLIIQCIVTSLRLYLNFKTAYEVIEIPHERLREDSVSSEDGATDRGSSEDFSLCLDLPPSPVPMYQVEYKQHQILAKVVIHRDKNSLLKRFNPQGAIVLDAEKLKKSTKRLAGYTGGPRTKRKVEMPLLLETERNRRRKRKNWTGSLEWPGTVGKFEGQLKKHWVTRSFEWHGFDADSAFSSPSLENVTARSFDWPVVGSGNLYSHEWHGFESDFGLYETFQDLFPNHEWHGFGSVQNMNNTSRCKLERLGSHIEILKRETHTRPIHQRFSCVLYSDKLGKPSLKDFKWPTVDSYIAKTGIKGSMSDCPVDQSKVTESTRKMPSCELKSMSIDTQTDRPESLSRQEQCIRDYEFISRSKDHLPSASHRPESQSSKLGDGIKSLWTDKYEIPSSRTKQNSKEGPTSSQHDDHYHQHNPVAHFQPGLERLDCDIEITNGRKEHEIPRNKVWQDFDSNLCTGSLENIPSYQFEWPSPHHESSVQIYNNAQLSFESDFTYPNVTGLCEEDFEKVQDSVYSGNTEHSSESPHYFLASQSLANLPFYKLDRPVSGDSSNKEMTTYVPLLHHGSEGDLGRISKENTSRHIARWSRAEACHNREEGESSSIASDCNSQSLEVLPTFKAKDSSIKKPETSGSPAFFNDLPTKRKKTLVDGRKRWKAFDDAGTLADFEWSSSGFEADHATSDPIEIEHLPGSGGEYSSKTELGDFSRSKDDVNQEKRGDKHL